MFCILLKLETSPSYGHGWQAASFLPSFLFLHLLPAFFALCGRPQIALLEFLGGSPGRIARAPNLFLGRAGSWRIRVALPCNQ